MLRHWGGLIKAKGLGKLYQYGIYKRLSWCFIYVFVVPILLIGIYNGCYTLIRNTRQANAFLEESTVQIANNLSSYLYDHMALLEEVASNRSIVSDLAVYQFSDWEKKSDIENHLRLIMGHTFGSGGAINTVELVTVDEAYFYFPSPVSNGLFDKSQILTANKEDVILSVQTKEIPSDRIRYAILSKGLFTDEGFLVGNIIAALELSYFNKACFENVSDLLNDVLIIDENETIISASDETYVGATFIDERLGSISISKSIPGTGLVVVNRIALSTLLRSAFIQFGLTLLVAIVFALLALFLAMLFTESISRPINMLIEEMGNEGINKYVADHGADEYHLIIEGFNLMSGHLVQAAQGQFTMQLQETELRALRKEAELSALQQQINPHFLYNSLESIYWSGQLEGDDEISEIVNALGNYLRVIIDKGREYVTVEDEVDSVNNYIFLQNRRFDERIHIDWAIKANLQKTKITKLVIHPIVEDVIAFNLDHIIEAITLNISVDGLGDALRIILNGSAVDYYLAESDSQEANNTSGINNVGERLLLYYGDAYGVVKDIAKGHIEVLVPIYQNQAKGGEDDE